MGIKRLSLADIEGSGPRGSVWFLNSVPSSDIKGPDGEVLSGDIIISIPKLNGEGGDPLIIKQTWLPTDASEHFPKNRLLESSEFRGAVRKGLITLIDEQTAESILNQDGAREERQRIADVAQHVKQAGASRKISDSNVDMYVPDSSGRRPIEEDENGGPAVQVYGAQDDDNLAKVTAGGIQKDEDGLTPSFKMFAERLKGESDINALNTIRGRSKFTRGELKFLVAAMAGKQKTVAALTERISKFKAKKKA